MRSWLPSLAAAIPGSASIASAAATTSARPARARLAWERIIVSSLVGERHTCPSQPGGDAKITEAWAQAPPARSSPEPEPEPDPDPDPDPAVPSEPEPDPLSDPEPPLPSLVSVGSDGSLGPGPPPDSPLVRAARSSLRSP